MSSLAMRIRMSALWRKPISGLTESAGFNVWYDARELSGGELLATDLQRAIEPLPLNVNYRIRRIGLARLGQKRIQFGDR
jgi:hypothetical protein